MTVLNATHDPSRQSWVTSANQGSDFPLQNLPFGRFRTTDGATRCGLAIGDLILDLGAAHAAGLFAGPAAEAAQAASGDDLLQLLTLGQTPASALRARLFDLLADDGDTAARAVLEPLLVPRSAVEMLLPTTVRQFSDMCVSTFHIGRRSGNDDRGQPICPPVFRTLPVGYDGRASSVIVSGTDVRRPLGQWQSGLFDGELKFGPEPYQDYELEVGLWFGGSGNAQGQPFSVREAADRMFGLCLLNDWSARGIQFWETMLGPFLGKSLATTVSPWIVTTEALAPFRLPAFPRPAGDPPVPPHLADVLDQSAGGFTISLTAELQTARMTDAATPPQEICRTDFRHMYWTFAQMLAHHASNGCALGPGDLIGSGTCSGPAMSEAACLVESLVGGPITLGDGETREWLEDGDTVILRGRAEREGFVPIGFGEARGTLLPAPVWPA